jgi:endogenous inhibitor of DNA gyrase (YacG/DUF329 family)
MARRKQSRGKCVYCGKEMTRGGMSKHLPACAARQKATAGIKEKTGASQNLYHLRVQDVWAGDFWLHLEMNGTATLNDLDLYLRAIWLECCGHLSDFFIGPAWGRKVSKKTPADRILQPGIELTHIYDFGTSSETKITVVDVRRGKPITKHPIALMARNNMPENACIECGQPATWLCIECVYEDETPGTLCDQHAKEHPHDAYGEPHPLLNSPRVGMCGYAGPADPPY